MFLSAKQETTPEELLPEPASVGDVDRFIQLLQTACDNRAVHKALERLLSQPGEQRKLLVHTWVTDMRANNAPRDFVHAVACLKDDGVADKAYEVIFPRQRKNLLARLRPQH